MSKKKVNDLEAKDLMITPNFKQDENEEPAGLLGFLEDEMRKEVTNTIRDELLEEAQRIISQVNWKSLPIGEFEKAMTWLVDYAEWKKPEPNEVNQGTLDALEEQMAKSFGWEGGEPDFSNFEDPREDI